VLHCYLNKEKTTIGGTGGYQKGMHKETEGQEQVVYTISKKEKSEA
jgi:hypothetical protein